MQDKLTIAIAAALLVCVVVCAKGIQSVDYIWIDLGEKNEGHLLTQAEYGGPSGDGVTEPDVKAERAGTLGQYPRILRSMGEKRRSTSR